MLKKLFFSIAVVILCVSVVAQVTPATLPADCDEFISGGAQGNALECIDMVIFLYEGAGPWDGTWESSGNGIWS